MVEDVVITNHGSRRVRKRLGLKTKAVKNHAVKVFNNGKIIQPVNSGNAALIEYQDRSYIFGLALDMKTPVLITVW